VLAEASSCPSGPSTRSRSSRTPTSCRPAERCEAVALGTPVWTTFEGRLGAVDERLIAEGRLRRLTSADSVSVVKRDGAVAERVRRDQELFCDLLIGGPFRD
jgi:hypothetical protein